MPSFSTSAYSSSYTVKLMFRKCKTLSSINLAKKASKRTAAGIPTWSPTVVLICRSTAYVWQSGRDAQFSADCGRT
ncbi:hypothetical protein KCU67_g11482, partial [Aureobasidium melanogenum]